MQIRCKLAFFFFAAVCLTTAAAEARPSTISIYGDFIYEDGARRPHYMNTPTTVEWYDGITVRAILRDAGLRPTCSRCMIHVGSGAHRFQVTYPVKGMHTNADLPLERGSWLSHWALLY